MAQKKSLGKMRSCLFTHVQKHLCHSEVSSAVLSDPADPSEVVLNLGVDARVVGIGAADAP